MKSDGDRPKTTALGFGEILRLAVCGQSKLHTLSLLRGARRNSNQYASYDREEVMDYKEHENPFK